MNATVRARVLTPGCPLLGFSGRCCTGVTEDVTCSSVGRPSDGQARRLRRSPSSPPRREARRSVRRPRSGRARPPACRRSPRSCSRRRAVRTLAEMRIRAEIPGQRRRVAPMRMVAGANARSARTEADDCQELRRVFEPHRRSRGRTLGCTERERGDDHDDHQDQLDQAVQPQGGTDAVRQSPPERAADRHPTEEPGEDGRDRLCRIPEDQDELTRPDDLIDSPAAPDSTKIARIGQRDLHKVLSCWAAHPPPRRSQAVQVKFGVPPRRLEPRYATIGRTKNGRLPNEYQKVALEFFVTVG